jgi:iron complex outermembrane receptor protein
VPIAITALSGEFLEEWNVLSVTDLQKFTPGLNVPQQDASKTFIHIRGVGSGKFDAGSSGSVGVFIDEIYLPRFSGADIGLLDLARVEVLKGRKRKSLWRPGQEIKTAISREVPYLAQ